MSARPSPQLSSGSTHTGPHTPPPTRSVTASPPSAPLGAVDSVYTHSCPPSPLPLPTRPPAPTTPKTGAMGASALLDGVLLTSLSSTALPATASTATTAAMTETFTTGATTAVNSGDARGILNTSSGSQSSIFTRQQQQQQQQQKRCSPRPQPMPPPSRGASVQHRVRRRCFDVQARASSLPATRSADPTTRRQASSYSASDTSTRPPRSATATPDVVLEHSSLVAQAVPYITPAPPSLSPALMWTPDAVAIAATARPRPRLRVGDGAQQQQPHQQPLLRQLPPQRHVTPNMAPPQLSACILPSWVLGLAEHVGQPLLALPTPAASAAAAAAPLQCSDGETPTPSPPLPSSRHSPRTVGGGGGAVATGISSSSSGPAVGGAAVERCGSGFGVGERSASNNSSGAAPHINRVGAGGRDVFPRLATSVAAFTAGDDGAHGRCPITGGSNPVSASLPHRLSFSSTATNVSPPSSELLLRLGAPSTASPPPAWADATQYRPSSPSMFVAIWGGGGDEREWRMERAVQPPVDTMTEEERSSTSLMAAQEMTLSSASSLPPQSPTLQPPPV
ncbi:hypothetical protein NESM_000294500 [Novymonas esmeraldas]|uniref:Uncharacterized protein n=1 Tax=Novymonas esmeraldas TaxID=1808958 RepID=A0AAW0F7Y5_9TRYP